VSTAAFPNGFLPREGNRFRGVVERWILGRTGAKQQLKNIARDELGVVTRGSKSGSGPHQSIGAVWRSDDRKTGKKNSLSEGGLITTGALERVCLSQRQGKERDKGSRSGHSSGQLKEIFQGVGSRVVKSI